MLSLCDSSEEEASETGEAIGFASGKGVAAEDVWVGEVVYHSAHTWKISLLQNRTRMPQTKG